MQTPARYKAVAELLKAVFNTSVPADNLISDYFRNRRYIGSKDRKFIADTTWNIIRHWRRLSFEAQSQEIRKIMLVYLREENLTEIFSGTEYAMPSITKQEKIWLQNLPQNPYPPAVEAECPDWIYKTFDNFNLFKSLTVTSTPDFRVNMADRNYVIQKLSAEGISVTPTPLSPVGIRAQGRINLNNCQTFLEGYIEPQDEASQLTAILADIKANEKTIDYCCGAGGKSLAISALMQNKGKIEAHDINSKRMDPLFSRMKRLQINNIYPVKTENIASDYDNFIIDAPCSGSGTWRRTPDAKFKLTPQKLHELTDIQQNLLQLASEKIKINGKIIYITCSVLPCENNLQIEHFLSRHANFVKSDLKKIWQQKIGNIYPFTDNNCLQFSPLETGTDGMFIAILQRVA